MPGSMKNSRKAAISMTRRNDLMRASFRQSIAQNRREFTILLIAIAAAIITSLLPPLVLEKAVTLINDRQSVPLTLALAYLGLIILSDVLQSGESALITLFGQKITHGLRSSMCAKLSRLPADYFTSHESGRTASIFTNDGDAIDVLYSSGVVSMFADFFQMLAILIILFTRSLGVGLLILILLPLLYRLTRSFQKGMKQAQHDNRVIIGKVNNHVPETIRNIRMIHVFQKEKYMEKRYDDLINESYQAVNRSNIYDSLYAPIILVTQTAVIAIMMIGAVSTGTMADLFGVSVGNAVAIIAYVGKIFGPLASIGMEIQNIQAAAAGLQRINDFLNEEEWHPQAVPARDTKDIVFEDVSFAYDPAQPVLQNLSFVIQPGEHVTFMGRTGSGKSTIFRLLLGLYVPQEGAIGLFGRTPCQIPETEKRKLYGCVEQSFRTVPGTIRDQVSLYDPEITDDMIDEALQQTGLREVVQALPQGLDTPMDEKLFSRGQLQLLAIARAIVCQPPLLLLDEITSSLDSETEERVLEALRRSARGRTVLSISHRLSGSLEQKRLIPVGPQASQTSLTNSAM